MAGRRPAATRTWEPATVEPSDRVSSGPPSTVRTEVTDVPVRTSTPCRRSTAVTTAEASGSSLPSTRSAPSTTVTSLPRPRKACASSTPMGPPPRTSRWAGCSTRSKTVLLVSGPASARPGTGGRVAWAPTARTTRRAVTAVPSTSRASSPSGRTSVKRGPAGQQVDALAREQRGRLVLLDLAHHRPHVRHDRGEVDRADLAHPEPLPVAGPRDPVGDVEQGLAGHAAVVGAVAAGPGGLDERHPAPGRAGGAGRAEAGGPGADDEQVVRAGGARRGHRAIVAHAGPTGRGAPRCAGERGRAPGGRRLGRGRPRDGLRAVPRRGGDRPGRRVRRARRGRRRRAGRALGRGAAGDPALPAAPAARARGRHARPGPARRRRRPARVRRAHPRLRRRARPRRRRGPATGAGRGPTSASRPGRRSRPRAPWSAAGGWTGGRSAPRTPGRTSTGCGWTTAWAWSRSRSTCTPTGGGRSAGWSPRSPAAWSGPASPWTRAPCCGWRAGTATVRGAGAAHLVLPVDGGAVVRALVAGTELPVEALAAPEDGTVR